MTLTRSLVINLQPFIRFSGIVLDFGILRNFPLLHTSLEQNRFVISCFRRFYVCSFSLTLCSLIFQNYAARLNFLSLLVVPLICLHSADFTWWQIWLNKCTTEDAQRSLFFPIFPMF